MRHLFPAGTLTDTVFLICLCTISAYTLTDTHIDSLTHSRTCAHLLVLPLTRTPTLTHSNIHTQPQTHPPIRKFIHNSASSQHFGECSALLKVLLWGTEGSTCGAGTLPLG